MAVVKGLDVHAGTAIDGRDRKRVERVCRYLVRPPIATECLGVVGENARYELKKVWRDGTRCVVLDPYDVWLGYARWCRRRIFIWCDFTACSHRMRHCDKKSWHRHGHRRLCASRRPSTIAVAAVR
ncbi:transposase [Polyangium jinanense]|uniref:Transposase n=1 Tax=Polyangium jinanense TaxID=2829994 RepID=A0A9X3XJC1_9BACT|nr:transposase [Polyangium jinanense]